MTGMFSRIWKSRSNLWNAQNGEIRWRCEFRISIDIIVPVWEYYSQCTHIDAIIGNPSSWERMYHIVPPIANISILQTAFERAGTVYVYGVVRSWLCWYHHHCHHHQFIMLIRIPNYLLSTNFEQSLLGGRCRETLLFQLYKVFLAK